MLFLTPDFVSSVNQPKRKRNLAAAKTRHIFWLILIIIGVIVADQITKLWAVRNLSDNNSISVIGDFFRLTLVYNYGGALGTSFGSSITYLVVALLILPLLGYYLYIHRYQYILAIPLAFITGGAVGNIIDRIYLGKVVDFVDIDFFDFNFFGQPVTRWWTFNIADAAISCGIVFLLVVTIFFKSKIEDKDISKNKSEVIPEQNK
jgi:signal peptidase II